MGTRLDTMAAELMLVIHIAWIVFVIVGAWLTRGRPWLAALHIASLLWGIVVEVLPLRCPLTVAENAFEARAGIVPYSGSFLVHYLDRIIYPSLSFAVIATFGVAVCVLNLGVYGYRLLYKGPR